MPVPIQKRDYSPDLQSNGEIPDYLDSVVKNKGNAKENVFFARSSPVIIDHSVARLRLLNSIPITAINNAKSQLHIAYGHTSHGSQVTDGMTGLSGFSGTNNPSSFYQWSEEPAPGYLDLDDYFMEGDLGNPDFSIWASRTRTYLDDPAHTDVNVVMWSWCGQVSWASEENINTYLNLMNQLELDYPHVTFVYMTGHLDGTGESGSLHQRNNQIRDYCRTNNKVLYDFADIESYDPDDIYYLNQGADDGCNYDGGNWAVSWQDSHIENVDWYSCGAQHTEPLNANLKAYAAWYLFARLGGWNGISNTNIGVFRGNKWYVDYNGNGAWNGYSTDRQYTFGLSGDKTVTGDWNIDGKTKIGVFRGNKWYVDYNGNGVWNGPSIDRQYTFGLSGDKPVIGDWNRDSKADIGVFRGRTWYLDYNGNSVWNGPSIDRQYTFGLSGDEPVTGDWDGDGKTNIGVFRGRTWYLDYNGNGVWNGPSTDRQYTFGLVGDKPVTGDWNSDGKTNIGVFRGRSWYLDYTGNGAWSTGDKTFTFGLSGDIPVTGKWSGSSSSTPSIQSVELNTVKNSNPTIKVPEVTNPVAAVPKVEMPVKSNLNTHPVTPGVVPSLSNSFISGGSNSLGNPLL
ncbi:hypothetical protein KHC33_01210 [Methanospirillum sp. J.3.6.1-F.2.7.3]|uniref:Uncharacterized protein n=2 Tax=Methanospirillum purgamenti TaxID=2834276 RepID=A0A8E7B1K9_9EURY|nr:hypothetical protein [Methanospirillum sp. J.3.6.1-F.2.7.3]MDX8551788.1 hypothetical protein [Methanospirillum hungatei]QVV89184.1 hypothetical protein KHC33_01210 [Methanospirillum sp. J.3.6.1-F.2.7.3]